MTYTTKQLEDANKALDSAHFVMDSLRELMKTDNLLLSAYAEGVLVEIVPVRDKIQRLKSIMENEVEE